MSRLSCLAFALSLIASPLAGAQAPDAQGHWVQKDFLITFWCPPPATDENLARVAEEGFNLTWVPEEGLDVSARHGLRVMLTSALLKPEVLEDAAQRAELDALIARVKGHPALEAYYLTDEPGAGAFPGLGRLVAYLRERDPAHLAYINLFPTYASAEQLGVSGEGPTDSEPDSGASGSVQRYREHLRRYIETVKPDLISYDHYHFFQEPDGGDRDGPDYFLNLGMIRAAALEARRPFLNIIQADTIIKTWRLPNASEMRWLVFTTMAYGGRGISYFTYWGPKEYNGLYIDGQKQPLMDDVAKLNHEIATIGPALMELESLGVYHTGPLPFGAEVVPADAPVQILGEGEFVLGVFGRDKGSSAFMIVNRDYRREAKVRVKVRIAGKALEELDRETGAWVRVKRLGAMRTVRLKLGAGDGRLFRVLP